MKARSKFNIWLWVLLCVPYLSVSCEHNIHDGAEDSGLSVALTWADKADQDTEVKDIKICIFNTADGSLAVEKHYDSAKEVASQRFQLPEGSYYILSCVNLTEPFTINGSTNLSNWSNIQIGLTNPKDVNHNAYFGVTEVKIDNKSSNYVAKVPVKSVLAELTVIIENVPQGTKMIGMALDPAECLCPTQKNGDGDYGLPSADPAEVELPTILETEMTIQSGIIRLMPTIRGSSGSHIYLCLTLPGGTRQEFDITAPAMKAGGKYELRPKYHEMQPKMNLDATINNWKNLNDEVEIK